MLLLGSFGSAEQCDAPYQGLYAMVVDGGNSSPPATKPKPTFSESQHFWLDKLQITIFNAHVGICCY